MDDTLAELPEVTLELTEEEVDAIDEMAFADHRGNREAAIRTLLAEYLDDREE